MPPLLFCLTDEDNEGLGEDEDNEGLDEGDSSSTCMLSFLIIIRFGFFVACVVISPSLGTLLLLLLSERRYDNCRICDATVSRVQSTGWMLMWAAVVYDERVKERRGEGCNDDKVE